MGFAFSGIALAADAPTSIYSDPPESAPSTGSVYDKVSSLQPMTATHQAATHAPQTLDEARKQYDDALATLKKAKEQADSRLHSDPKFDTLAAAANDAKNRYDNEIDDALSAISWNDEYQDMISAAEHAQTRYDFLLRNSPNDERSLTQAEHDLGDARRAVEDYEDDALDLDAYVQEARLSYLAAQDARDKVEDEAFANDADVTRAQVQVDRLEQTINTLAATASNQPQNSYQEPPPAYDDGASQPLPPENYAYAAPPVEYQVPEVYVPVPNVYYAVPSPYDYYAYPTAIVEIRDRYHHDHDHDDRFDHNHHDGDHNNDHHSDRNSGSSLANRWDGQQQMRNLQAQRDWQVAQMQNMQSVQNQQALQQSWADQQRQQNIQSRQAAWQQQQMRAQSQNPNQNQSQGQNQNQARMGPPVRSSNSHSQGDPGNGRPHR
jgi:hypothetical protein